MTQLTMFCQFALCRERNPGNNAVCLGYYDPPKGKLIQCWRPSYPVEINDRIFVYKCSVCTWLYGLAEPNHLVLMYQHKRPEDQQDDLGVFTPIQDGSH
jgi:hypothetical protein